MTLFKYYFILLLLVVLMACGTQKQATDNQNLNEKTENSKPVELSEEKRIEFEYLFIEGLKQKMLGNQEMAIQYFNGCLDINPQSATSLYELSGIYVLKGEIVSAKLLLEKAIQIDPSNKWYKLLLAQIYQGNNEYSKAGEIYAGLLQAEPDNVDYLYQSAMLSASSDQPKKALNAYNELERVVGYNEQIALARQQLYREMGENKKAYAEIQKLIDTFPDVPEYHGVMADMYKEDGKMEEALKHYHKVLEMDPSNGFVHFSLATFYLQDNKIDEGYSHARKGFSNPDVAIKTKIQLYLMLVNAPDAISLDDSDIEELVALIVEAHPDDARSYSIMADYLIQQKRSEEARDYMLKALDVSSDNYQLWEQLLMIDNELLDFESMAKHSEKAISLFPSQPLLYVLNAVANLQLKEYQKVLKSLESGQLYVADNKRMAGQFEMYRGEAYYNLGEKEKAFSSFDKAIGINSENYMALNNYAYYLSELGVELEKAEVMSGRVVQVHPDNPTYLDTHAWVLFKKGEYRLAKFYMDTAMQNGGDESDVVIEHYGDIHYKLGDVENALKYWRQSLEMGNSSKLLKKKIEEKRYIEGEE
jgi:tetratricopeptide (TPR) repeat protein